jgi:hypothetical protein
MLSDGIADLLFTGSNRLETRTEVKEKHSIFLFLFLIFLLKIDQIGLYLLRADQDLIDKFLPSTNSRRSSITENEIEYFIVNQDMICRVLNDHKIIRKIEPTNSPASIRRKSLLASTPSPSSHQRFFSQSLFNENTKTNPSVLVL